MRGVRRWWALGVVASLAGCASTGATWRAGVGDLLLEHPPFQGGRSLAELGTSVHRVGHFPVAYQRGAAQAPIFDPSLDPALLALLGEMTAYLDSLHRTVRLVEGERVSAVTSAATQSPPDVSFGCVLPSGIADDQCLPPPGDARGRGPQPMRLAVGRPSDAWRGWAGDVMKALDVDAALVVTLEVGRYPIRQVGWQGNKEVVLASDYAVRLPWLTSLDQSIFVFQLTGALVARDGTALRIAAQGMLPRRTPFLASAAGLERLMTPADVAALRAVFRDDLPGRPLVWQVALHNLVESLVPAPGPAVKTRRSVASPG